MSKALKALEIIKNAGTIYVGCASDIYTRYSFECKEIEKSLKALEIIIKKRVNMLEISTTANYETYMSFFDMWNFNGEYDEFVLTKEEYDLLKEILL